MIRYKDDGSVDIATSPFTVLEVGELIDHLDSAYSEIAALRECVRCADAMRATHLPHDPAHGMGLVHDFDESRTKVSKG